MWENKTKVFHILKYDLTENPRVRQKTVRNDKFSEVARYKINIKISIISIH